jgi:hypothetical protein
VHFSLAEVPEMYFFGHKTNGQFAKIKKVMGTAWAQFGHRMGTESKTPT